MARYSFKPGNILNPLPVVMVSVTDETGFTNVLTVAWTGTICSDPAMLSISVRPERFSYGMLKRSGEFVVNLVTKELAFACDFCGVKSGRDTDKLKALGLDTVAVDNVSAKGILQSPVNIGCRIVEEKKLGSHSMFISEVVGVNVEDSYMDEKGRFDLNSLGLIAYSHGEYIRLGEKVGKFGFSVKKDTARPKNKKRR